MTQEIQQVNIAAQRTPFHRCAERANLRNDWYEWKGYTTSNIYFDAELEYFAIRNTSALFDLCPMNKYLISGPDAQAFLNRLVTRDVAKLRQGRVSYVVWCNDAGKILDDGTLFHLRDGSYRLCAYEYQLAWLTSAAIGFDVTIEDDTKRVAALALQGPTSCAILKDLGLTGIENLKAFGIEYFNFAQTELMVSRTGFTGDLGYELWIDPEHAETLWDALFEAGKFRGIQPMGAHALEMARIEAGFLQAGTDFLDATEIIRPGRARSPLELGLDWVVDFDKPFFNGKRALLKEKEHGSTWRLVKLDVEGNKPAESSYLYAGQSKQIGFVTSAMWSPVCKSNIAIGTVKMPYGKPGDEIYAEIYYQREMHWSRVMAKCEIVDKPFWEPSRRRATPPADF